MTQALAPKQEPDEIPPRGAAMLPDGALATERQPGEAPIDGE